MQMERQVQESEAQGKAILIVEDNQLNLKLMRTLLTREGYSVASASSAAETRQVLTTFRPQLVLMDIQLPDGNGVDLARHLKSEDATRDLVIVALTAYDGKGDAEKALAAGCAGYITKPVDARTLPALLGKYLDAAT